MPCRPERTALTWPPAISRGTGPRRCRRRRRRSPGTVIVTVRGGARPRAVPVLARYQGRLLAAAASAGTGLVCGGTDPGRRNITTPLIRSLAGGDGLPRLDTSRLRHLAGRRRPANRAGHVHARRRDHLLPAARRPARQPGTRRRARRRPAPRRGPAVMIPLPVLEDITDRSGIAPRIELLLPIGVRARQLAVRTLLPGILIVLADHRPAHPRPPGTDHAARGRPAAPRRDRRTGNTARTSSPAARPSGPSAWSPASWPGTSPTGCPPPGCSASAMTCSRHPSPKSSRTPARRWPPTGPTPKPSPARRPAAPATAPAPKPPGATAPAAAPARTASCSSATTPPPPP